MCLKKRRKACLDIASAALRVLKGVSGLQVFTAEHIEVKTIFEFELVIYRS
jgi:hypothetical protein